MSPFHADLLQNFESVWGDIRSKNFAAKMPKRAILTSQWNYAIGLIARAGAIRYTRHAINRINEYKLTTGQVIEMLKNCSHNQRLDDANGHRVTGRAPALDAVGTVDISAHIKLISLSSNKSILVITVINN